MAAPIAIHLEFGGGAELLFNGVKDHRVTLPSQSEPWDMKQLLVWIQENLLKERPELFVQGDSVVNWSTSFRTRTILCSSPHFMEVNGL
ncbi:ubiquitin-related modifier 1 isoform X2 [Hemibagrus wyckioides]|uniref:ubiquitin-related modifier 1 isoform X2 n=1 Tax=Hemibagrus wyckioides TaxID=337641 RepID=UPI00266C57C3|nr:ubiquitin-related modifier 1 isoform X2 [Hemibagrus wyckioides]